MNIDFSWVLIEHLEKKSLNRYCDTNKAVELCWWLHTEVVDTGCVCQEIHKMIDGLQEEGKRELRGDMMFVHFNKKNIVLENPLLNTEFDFCYEEFKSAIAEWELFLTEKHA